MNKAKRDELRLQIGAVYDRELHMTRHEAEELLDGYDQLEKTVEAFVHWGKSLATQDNATTSDPLFIVEDEERVYGVSADYREGTETYADDDGTKTRLGYVKRWKFVTACLTRVEASRVIHEQRHNLKNPRVFTASGYMNPGWKALRSALLKIAADLA